MKKVAITGASGFVGQNLIRMFTSNGFEVVAIKRAELKDDNKLISILNNCEVVVNLAGANIIARWDEMYKKLLFDSRIDTTKALIRAMRQCDIKPRTFISTSAVGIYNNKRQYSEDNIEYEDDFLGELCRAWEKEALKAQELDVRTIIFRFGIVMGKDGGALSQMLTPFKFGLGGTIGNGSQAFSFIHIEDLINAYKHAVENDSIIGEYNMTAPVPTTNKGLTKALGATLNRPTFLPVPEFVLRLIFSEGAKVLTDGQSVIPKRLQESGFEFKYKTIEDTIENLLGE